MAPMAVPGLFVQDYLKVSSYRYSSLNDLKLLGNDDGIQGFQKVLDMKGMELSSLTKINNS